MKKPNNEYIRTAEKGVFILDNFLVYLDATPVENEKDQRAEKRLYEEKKVCDQTTFNRDWFDTFMTESEGQLLERDHKVFYSILEGIIQNQLAGLNARRYIVKLQTHYYNSQNYPSFAFIFNSTREEEPSEE